MFFKRSVLTIFVPMLLIGLLLAACGSASANNPPASPSTSSYTSPTPTPTIASKATATPAASSSTLIKTASATVQGKATTVLTNAQGQTLYYYKPDTATSVACTGSCASAWPPLLFTGSGTPTSSTPLPGKLSVINGANGAQVEYQGHPLYTYAGDTAPGQTSGAGLGGVWFVATVDLQTGASSTSYGNGY